MPISSFLKSQLLRIKSQSNDLLYRRDLFAKWIANDVETHADLSKPYRVLDLGCGDGSDLREVLKEISKRGLKQQVEVYGLESYPPSVAKAQSHGVRVSSANIESDKFPFPDHYFDSVISNQTIEHTKEIFWIFAEVSRVLKPQGLTIHGFPNLASLHNRILLLFGFHPTSIELLGPHVRGISYRSFKTFLETDGYFQVTKYGGGHFYPFPRSIAQALSKIFPLSSASLFVAAKRTSKKGTFLEVIKTRFFETPFFKGSE